MGMAIQEVGTRCVIGHRHVPLLYIGYALDTASENAFYPYNNIIVNINTFICLVLQEIVLLLEC